MSDVDDLVAAMVLGDPGETVPLDIVTAMAKSAIGAYWIPCPHTDWVEEHDYDRTYTNRTCTRCGAQLVVQGGYIVTEPEATDG